MIWVSYKSLLVTYIYFKSGMFYSIDNTQLKATKLKWHK